MFLRGAIKIILLLILIFATTCASYSFQNSYKITIIDKNPSSFVQDLDDILGTVSHKISQNTYKINLPIKGKYTPKDYYVLFSNIPAVSKIDGEKVVYLKEENLSPPCENCKPSFPTHPKNAASYVQGEVLLKLKQGSPAKIIDKINRIYGTKTIEYMKELNIYRLKIPKNRNTKLYIKILKMSPYVEYAEPNQIYHIETPQIQCPNTHH